jgi:hypothetical protein
MTNKETYIFLKENINKTILRKNLPKSINWSYVRGINIKWQKGAQIVSETDEFIVSDAGKNFIDDYELALKPIQLASEANKLSRQSNVKANQANYISLAALIVSIIALLIRQS